MARLRQQLRKRKDTRSYFTTMVSTRRDAAWKWAGRDVRCRQLWYIIISAVVPRQRQMLRAFASWMWVRRDSCLATHQLQHSLKFRMFVRMIVAIGALQICLRLFVKGNRNINCVLKEICWKTYLKCLRNKKNIFKNILYARFLAFNKQYI